MITRLEVHHAISKDVTNVYEFSLLSGIRDIPAQLASKVKASIESLRVFPSPAEASKDIYFGDRLDDFCSLLVANRSEAVALLKAGHFNFNEDSTMLVFHLRVDHEVPLEKLPDPESLSSEAMHSMYKGHCKVKLRKRETKAVLNIVETAVVYVWPRDSNGFPLPTNRPRGGSKDAAATSTVMTKPSWVDHHLALNIKSLAAQYGVQLSSSVDSLRAKAVRLVNGWRQDMLAGGSQKAVHADRFASWRASPYGKMWMSGDFRAPSRAFTPCLAKSYTSKASTESTDV